MPQRNFLALDVGQKRIGVALADSSVKIAVPYGYLEQADRPDGREQVLRQVVELVVQHEIDTIVVGYPRNQSGEPTQQTTAVEQFVNQLTVLSHNAKIVYQDESLTSVQAEARLGRVIHKGDIDAEAASIILQDYMEAHI